MRFRLSQHALSELRRRSIPAALLRTVLEQPDQIVPAHGGLTAYQSRLDFDGTIYLVRALVRDDVEPAVVVTAYRTSKISKYWRQE